MGGNVFVGSDISEKIFLHVKKTNNQSLPSETWQKVLFDFVISDKKGIWDEENNQIVIMQKGFYFLVVEIGFYALGTDVRGLVRIMQNANLQSWIGFWAGGYATMKVQDNCIISASKGDTIYIEARQDSGEDKNITEGQLRLISL